MGRNAMLGKHIKDKYTCQVCRHDGVMGRDKDCLLGELVDYDQDSVKPRG